MTNYLFYLLVLINLRKEQGEIFRYSCRKDGLFKLIARDTKLKTTVNSTEKAKSLSLCAKHCIANNQCRSFNYQKSANQCEILQENKTTSITATFSSASGWKHYAPIEGQGHLQPICGRKLSSNPCGNCEVRCVDDCSKAAGYSCVSLSNIALRKPTSEGPGSWGPPCPGCAVDGNTNTNFFAGSCSHTDCCSVLPWWRVDFGKIAFVYSVKITNRGDCCGNRLSNFNIKIGNTTANRGDANPTCVRGSAIGQGATTCFICQPPLYGRYLFVQNNLNEALTLCEVQIFGELL